MEPVTHFLTGTMIGRAGFQRKSAYAVLAATLAAEAADLDILWSFGGPVTGLEHHRGITHTFVAVPVVAAVVCGFCWLLDRYWLRREKVQWLWVYAAAFVAACSHLLLDWTNNYGIRPFFPWNPRWYAGSFVFIAEPVLWGLLLAGVILPWLLGLVAGEVGAKRSRAPGQRTAIAVLAAIVLLWSLRWFERERALQLTANEPAIRLASIRTTAEPYPANPFRWHTITETAHTWRTAEVDTLSGIVTPGSMLYKPAETAAVRVAKQSYLGRVYLDWAAAPTGWAAVTDLGPIPVNGDAGPAVAGPQRWTTVEFRDLRFEYSFWQKPDKPTIGGWVYVIDNTEVAGEFLGNRAQR